jgi:hypothetical protein
MNVTFTFGSSSAARAGAVSCFAKGALATSSQFDVNPADTTNGSSTYSAPASGTLAQANEWVIGVFAWAGPSTDSIAAANGYSNFTSTGIGTTGSTASGNVHLYMDYLSVSSTSTTTPQATDSTANRAGAQRTISFKRSGASAGSPNITINGTDTTVNLQTKGGTNPTVINGTVTATYPSNAAAIGLKSPATNRQVYLYEAGVMVAYVPAVVALTCRGLALLGVGCEDGQK